MPTPSETLRLQRELAAGNRNKPRLVSRSRVPFPTGFKAWISQTNEMIEGGSYVALRTNFDKYIKKKGLNIPDPVNYLDAAICEGIRRVRGNSNGYCVAQILGSPQYQLIQKYHQDARGPKNLKRGPHGRDAFAWKALHLAALDGKLNSTFIEDFTRQIGCGSCKAHWRTIIRQYPPNYADAFAWSVNAHNLVSRKLSPPLKELSVEDARNIWTST